MSQCVPSWEVDDPPAATSLPLHDQPTSAAAPLVPLDYEVAELTWENGQLALHGFGGSPRMGKPVVKSAPTGPAAAANANWSKHQPPGAGGTLESVVNQATGVKLFPGTAAAAAGAGRALGLGGWIGGPHHGGGDGGVPAVLLDALVPCRDDADAGAGRRVPDAATAADGESGRKRTRAIAGVQCSSQGSAAAPVVGRGRRMESTLVTIDTCGTTDDFGITNTATATTMATNSVSLDEGGDGSPDTDSVSHSRRSQPKRDACEEDAKASKKSRAAAIHNQSERKRRDRINQKMKTLQKLVPNSSKTDKASILDEVIEYLKQLQAQVQMMSRMNSMMMPMAMPPQIQMSIMANMAHMAQMAQMAQMGMMDAGAVSRAPSAYPPLPPLLHPSAAAFLPTAGGTWDGVYGADQMAQQPAAGGSVLPDPLSALIACQNAQPMTMDAYSRMATMFQQFYHQQQQQQQPTPPPPPTAPTSNPKT